MNNNNFQSIWFWNYAPNTRLINLDMGNNHYENLIWYTKSYSGEFSQDAMTPSLPHQPSHSTNFLSDDVSITVTSQWARWRLRSPASRLFTQPFIQAQNKENIKAPRHRPLWGEFTGDRWIPRTKGQLRGKCFHLMTSYWWWSKALVSYQICYPVSHYGLCSRAPFAYTD